MIIVIIQARMGSSRLPGKVMLNLCGKPVLEHIVERINYSKYVDKIIVATSEKIENDKIRDFCVDNRVSCFSGNEEDVLDRFYKAAKHNDIQHNDIVIRITADCPLIDPEVIDKTVEYFKNQNADYAANIINPTYPDGLDCEVMKFTTLEQAWLNASLKSEREHVTLYIRNHPELFKLTSVENNKDISSLRWTLDEEKDFELITLIYDKLYKEDKIFYMNDILDLISNNPRIANINSDIKRNEGLLKSLANDNNVKF